MKEMKILQAMNMVDDEYLEEMNMENKKEPGRKRNVLKLFLIAALVAVLGVGVFAHEYVTAGGDWFYSFFAGRNRQEMMDDLTDNQQEILSQGLVEIGQSMTVDGWTVTLESGISDGYRMLIKYRIDAPEDVVLDATYSLDFMQIVKTAEGKKIDGTGAHVAQWIIRDENPNDNSMTKIIDCRLMTTSQGETLAIPNGAVVHLEIYNIQRILSDGNEIKRQVVSEENWEFEVELGEAYLATETVAVADKTDFVATCLYKDYEFDVKLKVISAELRTLTAKVTLEKTAAEYGCGFFLGPLQVVLKDGSVIESRASSLIHREDCFEWNLAFDRPISMADVDHIEYPKEGVDIYQ